MHCNEGFLTNTNLINSRIIIIQILTWRNVRFTESRPLHGVKMCHQGLDLFWINGVQRQFKSSSLFHSLTYTNDFSLVWLKIQCHMLTAPTNKSERSSYIDYGWRAKNLCRLPQVPELYLSSSRSPGSRCIPFQKIIVKTIEVWQNVQ